jgi:hypothetical protein
MGTQRVTGSNAVTLIATLLRGDDERWPLLLLGAGASFRSGVPTAAEAVKQIARMVYSERKLLGNRPPERVKPSEWEPWLREQTWFDPHADTAPILWQTYTPLAIAYMSTRLCRRYLWNADEFSASA